MELGCVAGIFAGGAAWAYLQYQARNAGTSAQIIVAVFMGVITLAGASSC